MNRLKLIFILISIFIFSHPALLKGQDGTAAIIRDWNNFTFKSINRQLINTLDSSIKTMIQNRKAALFNFLNLDDTSKNKAQNSIRFSFWETMISEEEKNIPNKLLIETTHEGYTVSYRNYLVWEESPAKTRVEFYTFLENKWVKMGGLTLNYPTKINYPLSAYDTTFGKGKNLTDIILTKIENNKVINSEFYLFSTLSSANNLNAIIKSYRKENFY